MEIDESAPAVARHSVEIAAPPEIVWEVLVDIGSWTSWNPDVQKASLEGELEPGSTFRWKAGPGTITSTIQEVRRPTRISWTGKTFGINAVHCYQLEARADGTTAVLSEESWNGLPVRLLRGVFERQLRKATESGLDHLKREVERRSAA